MLYGFGGDASGGYGFGGETGGGVSEFGGFFFKTRAKSIEHCVEGVYYSGIIDEKAPETVPLCIGRRQDVRGRFFYAGNERRILYAGTGDEMAVFGTIIFFSDLMWYKEKINTYGLRKDR